MLIAEVRTVEVLGIVIPSGVAFLSIVAAVVIYFRQKPKVGLRWQTLTNERILNPNAPSGVSIMHRGSSLANPRLLTVRVQNFGRRAIAETDWRKPLTIRVPGADIIDARVLKVSNDVELAIGLNIAPDDAMTVNPPPFLNVKMYVDFQLILEAASPKPCEVSAVLFGESHSIKKASDYRYPYMLAALAGMLVAAIAGISFGLFSNDQEPEGVPSAFVTVLILAVLWLIVIVPMLLRASDERRLEVAKYRRLGRPSE